MLYNYLTLPFCGKERKIFLQDGFNPIYLSHSPFHKHFYSEIHMVHKGTVVYFIENKAYTLQEGSILMIPPKTYHCIQNATAGAIYNAFQIEYDCKEIIHRYMSKKTLNDFLDEIEKSDQSGNYAKVLPYISLVISNLLDSYQINTNEITDDAYIIHEFFAKNYNQDAQVSELAEILHLSEKQTQLLVKRHTGRTFKQELAHYKMKIADYLISNTDLSMTEIAYKVGFQTYSGFWKMYKARQE